MNAPYRHAMGEPASAAGHRRFLLSTQSMAPGNGGVAAVARMTARVLAEHHAVRALACQDRGNYEVERVPVAAFDGHILPFVIWNFRESRKSTHVIYDHPATARAHLDAPFSSRPYAVWIHGWEIWEQAPAKYVRAVAGASLVLANSAYTAERGRHALSGIVPRICTLGTSGNECPAHIGPSVDPPTVMLLGRIDDLFAKGHDVLIEIWPQVVSAVPDARLLLVGGGTALERVRAMAAASAARESIEITGFVASRGLEDYWRRATVFAMPGFAEGFGLVYVDAMRHGLPVIASTDDGGQDVNVDGVTGYNVARADRKRMVDAIVSLLRDPDKARTMGAAGHALWQRTYTFDCFRDRLLDVMGGFLS